MKTLICYRIDHFCIFDSSVSNILFFRITNFSDYFTTVRVFISKIQKTSEILKSATAQSLFSADLDVLSVKQLKELLMLNRVDFKGCCEKPELRERVLRLWRDFKSIPCENSF